RNGSGRADVDAARAAGDARAPVGADLLLLLEILRLLELADELRDFVRGERLRERIGTGREVSLRQLFRPDHRFAREIQDQVECVAALRIFALEVDGTDLAACRDALAV